MPEKSKGIVGHFFDIPRDTVSEALRLPVDVVSGAVDHVIGFL